MNTYYLKVVGVVLLSGLILIGAIKIIDGEDHLFGTIPLSSTISN